MGPISPITMAPQMLLQATSLVGGNSASALQTNNNPTANPAFSGFEAPMNGDMMSSLFQLMSTIMLLIGQMLQLLSQNAGGNASPFSGMPTSNSSEPSTSVATAPGSSPGTSSSTGGADTTTTPGSTETGNTTSGNPPTAGRLDGITPDQGALPLSDKYSLCGPVAAMALGRFLGKDISIHEARAAAVRNGYTPAEGTPVKGLQNAMSELGINTRVDWNATWDQIAAEVQKGRPVIVNIPGHYFVVEGYDPATGRFNFGNSAKVFAANKNKQEWFTPDELSQIGYGRNIQAAFFLT